MKKWMISAIALTVSVPVWAGIGGSDDEEEISYTSLRRKPGQGRTIFTEEISKIIQTLKYKGDDDSIWDLETGIEIFQGLDQPFGKIRDSDIKKGLDGCLYYHCKIEIFTKNILDQPLLTGKRSLDGEISTGKFFVMTKKKTS